MQSPDNPTPTDPVTPTKVVAPFVPKIRDEPSLPAEQRPQADLPTPPPEPSRASPLEEKGPPLERDSISESPALPAFAMADHIPELALSNLKPGKLIKGRVTEITDDYVSVDIKAKADGLIPVEEFAEPGELTVDSRIEVFLDTVETAEARPRVSYEKALAIRTWERIENDWEKGKVIPGKVRSAVKGGLIVNVGIDCFLPASQIDVGFVDDFESYLGQTYEFKVIRIDLGRRRVVLSRRALLEEQIRRKRQEFYGTAKVGDLRRGVVTSIHEYGAFVDLGGLDGLLHITDMSWGRIEHASELLHVGEEIEVRIKSIEEERDRVGLSLRDTPRDPWLDIESRFEVGSTVEGKVARLMPFGAFVEVATSLEGLIHLSEFSWARRVVHPKEMLTEGERTKVVVIGIDKEEKKLALSLRRAHPNPWHTLEKRFPVGTQARATVHRLASFGAFVGLEGGVEGLIHISDMSWTKRVRNPSEIVSEGQEVDVVVLDIDAANQRLALGMKQVGSDPWDHIESLFKLGQVVSGTVARLTRFGAFITLPHGIDGLAHISEITDESIQDPSEVLKIGQKVTTRITKIDQLEHRIGLSLRNAGEADEAESSASGESETSGGLNSLADLFDQAGMQ